MSLLLAFGGAGPPPDDPNTRLALFDVLEREDDDHAFYAFLAAIVEDVAVADDSETRIFLAADWWADGDEYEALEVLLAGPVEESVEHLLFSNVQDRDDLEQEFDYSAIPESVIEDLVLEGIEWLLFVEETWRDGHDGQEFDYAEAPDRFIEDSVEFLLGVLPTHEIEPDDDFHAWLDVLVEDSVEWLLFLDAAERQELDAPEFGYFAAPEPFAEESVEWLLEILSQHESWGDDDLHAWNGAIVYDIFFGPSEWIVRARRRDRRR